MPVHATPFDAPTTPDIVFILRKRIDLPMEFDVFLEQDETGTWIAEVPSLPGVYTQGDTREEALRNVKDAIKLFIDTEGPPPSRAVSTERVRVEA